jgi:anti-anti-sigma factor
MAKLSIDTELSGDATIVKVAGRVDSETAPDLDDSLVRLQGEGVKNIVLNLGQVDFLSSAGLRAIIKAYQAAGKSGGDVRLGPISQPVEMVLHTLGFNLTLKTYPTTQEAVGSFAA